MTFNSQIYLAKYENICVGVNKIKQSPNIKKLIFLLQNVCTMIFFLINSTREMHRCYLNTIFEHASLNGWQQFPVIFHAASLDQVADIACVALFTTTKKNVERIDTQRGRLYVVAAVKVVALKYHILITFLIWPWLRKQLTVDHYSNVEDNKKFNFLIKLLVK